MDTSKTGSQKSDYTLGGFQDVFPYYGRRGELIASCRRGILQATDQHDKVF